MPNMPVATIVGHPGAQSVAEIREHARRVTAAEVIANLTEQPDEIELPEEPTSREIVFRGSFEEVNEHFWQREWSDGLPIVWLQDISGFDIGVEAERQGLLAYGSNLIYTNSTNSTPMFTVLLRKASGAGYYAMAGLPYDPVVQLSTPLTRLSVMEGRTLAIATYNTKLDDNFEILAKDPDERRAIFEIHLAQRKQDPAAFSLDPLLDASDGFSGAEIEQAVIAALYRSLHEKRPLSTELLLDELNATVPLSVSRMEEVARLRQIGSERFVPVR